MTEKLRNRIITELKQTVKINNAKCYEFDLGKLVFEERVKLLCMHCEKYNKSWTCPPKINHINYKKAFGEYDNALVVQITGACNTDAEYQFIRKKTTNDLHSLLLSLENILWYNQYVLAVSFIGGSCKLCDNCPTNACRQPYLARVPWEGTGVNVIKSVKAGCGIDIKYSNRHISRYGLIIW